MYSAGLGSDDSSEECDRLYREPAKRGRGREKFNGAGFRASLSLDSSDEEPVDDGVGTSPSSSNVDASCGIMTGCDEGC